MVGAGVNPGRLNRRVTLFEPVRTRDEASGWETQYVEAGCVWAEFRRIRAGPDKSIGESLALEIAIRYRPGVAKGWHVSGGGKTYEVNAVYDENKELTVLLCEEVLSLE